MSGIKDFLLLVLRGVAMGAADVIPGVSGGTIAFITGIYEELLRSIKAVDVEALKMLLGFQIKVLWAKVNGNFLVAVFLGILISVFSLVRLISYAMIHYPILLWSFFFGLILISALVVARSIDHWKPKTGILLVAGALLAYLITSATPASTPDGLIFVFLSGVIAICAMILPGISGSFLLLIMGKYELILSSVKNMDVLVLVVFALGCLVGILSFARLISWLLDRFRIETLATLVGFMIGSLNKVWPWRVVIQYRMNSKNEQVPFIEDNVLPTAYADQTGSPNQLALAILFFAVGIGMVVIIDKLASRQPQ